MAYKQFPAHEMCRYLEQLQIPYEYINNGTVVSTRQAPQNETPPAGVSEIDSGSVYKSIVLKRSDVGHDQPFVITAIPGNHFIDMDRLSRLLKYPLEPVAGDKLDARFQNNAISMFLPIAHDNGMDTIVDEKLLEFDEIHFQTTAENEFIRIKRKHFRHLHIKSILGREISTAKQLHQDRVSDAGQQQQVANIKKRMAEITELPPMPEMAQQIILLNANPYATAKDLAALIELDPSLTAQVLCYARSPFFGYRGKVTSIQQAISRVLGFDMVMNIALGLATAAPFKNSRQGPLGLDAFWRHAIYSASLSQIIVDKLPQALKVDTGLAYLCGLLHNFGFLILGHLFPEQFDQLNRLVMDDPHTCITDQEVKLLNIDHTVTGAWLMQAWNMPPQIITTIQQHHNEKYTGPYRVYANIVLLADRLLKVHDIGDADSDTLPRDIMQTLQLNESQLEKAIQLLSSEIPTLDSIVDSLAA